MTFSEWFEQWGISQVKLSKNHADLQFNPTSVDQAAAWELYVELQTRVTTQGIDDDQGDEKAALASLHAIFPLTRAILKRHGIECVQFGKIAITVLNQVIRPVTTKWHRRLIKESFANPTLCQEFRTELRLLQKVLQKYALGVADIAKVQPFN